MKDPSDLLIGDDGDGVVSRVYETLLGVKREAHVCPDCNTACEQATVHDPNRAAWDGGESPSWYCEECQTHYVRELDEQAHALDLYGRE